MNDIKIREDKARRELKKQGLLLRKSRTGGTITDKNGVPQQLVNDFGGYMVVDGAGNYVVAGSDYELTIDDVENFISEN